MIIKRQAASRLTLPFPYPLYPQSGKNNTTRFLKFKNSVYLTLTFLTINLLAMKTETFKGLALIALAIFYASILSAQVHTTYLWHQEQPVYWPETSVNNPFRWQKVKESHDLKFGGGNVYASGLAHPLNDLEHIFSKDDRVAAYQWRMKESLESMLWAPKAGVQVNYSACLIENMNSLADANQWGYYPGWENDQITSRQWTTSGGFPRMDILGFSYHHALSPLVSEEVLRKQIQAHKIMYASTFGNSPEYSKGYWPAECSFSERNIKVLVEEGFDWTVVANSKIARTLADYPLSFGTNGSNYDPPNQADVTNLSGDNWWSGQTDGRGGTFASPICYTPHWARYVDPETGDESRIIAVPMADLLSYRDGYAPMSTDDIEAHVAPYAPSSRPPLVLLAHDGDNAFGGGFSYYLESVPGFVSQAVSKGYTPTTIEQYLSDYPVPFDDVVHIEDGSWVNAANDWGHVQFVNWMWPQYNPETHEFDPEGWQSDIRNWAVLTAADHYCQMAEDLSGGVDMEKIVYPGPASSDAELAWHFLLPGYNSGYLYYGVSIDMEVKPSLAANNAIAYAEQVINAHAGQDDTPPNVFVPQRYPYNPGGTGFGPNYGYQQFQNPSDFTIWTLVYDVSGIDSIALAIRIDEDGINPIDDDANETYAGGAGVGEWQYLPMVERPYPAEDITNNPEIDYFIMPDAIATQYYAKVEDLSEVLIDYYVVAIDSHGNERKTDIQHVYIGASTPVSGGGGSGSVSWTPLNPAPDEVVAITVSGVSQGAKLHWGLSVGSDTFVGPIAAYLPEGTEEWPSSDAVETPFSGPDEDGNLYLELGPFDLPEQLPLAIDFVIHYDDDSWDNNNGQDYRIFFESDELPPGVSWTPAEPTRDDEIQIFVNGASQGANLHWAISTPQGPWQSADPVYWPAGSFSFSSGPAVESPFSGPLDGLLSLSIGPFSDPAQEVQGLNFVIHFDDDTWDNNNGQDYFIPIASTPLPECPQPTGLQSTVHSSTSVTLSWDPVPGAQSLILEGRRLDGPGRRTLLLSGSATSRSINGLFAGANYGWRLRAVCADGLEGPNSPNQFFTMPHSTAGGTDVHMWPNPTSDFVQVQLRGYDEAEVYDMHLYSSDGRLVWSGQSAGKELTVIPLTHLAAGMYHLRIGAEQPRTLHLYVN